MIRALLASIAVSTASASAGFAFGFYVALIPVECDTDSDCEEKNPALVDVPQWRFDVRDAIDSVILARRNPGAHQ